MVPTQDHDEIRRWAVKHHATPVQMKLTKFDGEPAQLHFLIGRDTEGTEELQPISWDTFFAQFDLLHLALAYDNRSSQFDLVSLEKPKTGHYEPVQN